MLKIENVVLPSPEQWQAIIMGTRNPLNSWARSDSRFIPAMLEDEETYSQRHFEIGQNDLDLMRRLRRSGADHRKFMRMITVYLDITAPLYWWKEFSTYKVGTVANSCSTMHKIHAKEFTLDDFSHEHLLYPYGIGNCLSYTISILNHYRDIYLNGGVLPFEDKNGEIAEVEYEPKDKDIWWQMIQLLPSSYNQKRTVMLNYEVLCNVFAARCNHRLDEWKQLCAWMRTLPYSELITGEKDE